MPLSPGHSRAVISQNIREMMDAGYPQKQAVAASLSNARRHPHAAGGKVAGFADGGAPQNPQEQFLYDWHRDNLATPGAAVHNPDGSISTIYDISMGGDGRTYNVPTVYSGHKVSPQVAETYARNIGLSRFPSYPDVDTAERRYGEMHDMMARDIPYKAGGKVQHFDDGGFAMMRPPIPSFAERSDLRQILSAPGGLHSPIPGRTDQIPMSVAADSYVLPADVVSGLGEGNTLAGTHLLDLMFHTGPYGMRLPNVRPARGNIPRPPTMREPRARGGMTSDYGEHMPDARGHVPIVAAGGEFVVDRDTILHHPSLGALPRGETDPKKIKAALNHGHQILDHFVSIVRKKTIKDMSHLPPPKK